MDCLKVPPARILRLARTVLQRGTRVCLGSAETSAGCVQRMNASRTRISASVLPMRLRTPAGLLPEGASGGHEARRLPASDAFRVWSRSEGGGLQRIRHGPTAARGISEGSTNSFDERIRRGPRPPGL